MPEKLRFSLQGTRKTDEGNDFRRAIVAGEIEKAWKSTTSKISEISDTIAFSAAGKVFDQLLDEFLKNSTDAEADFLDFSVAVENNIITIQINDDGKKEIPTDKLGRYDWRKALLEKSQKSPKNQLGGRNLGLAIAAHFLETQGQGELHLTKNPNGNGAAVILKSSNKNLGDLDVMPEGLNYARMMINVLKKEGANPTLIEELENRYPLRRGERVSRSYSPQPLPLTLSAIFSRPPSFEPLSSPPPQPLAQLQH